MKTFAKAFRLVLLLSTAGSLTACPNVEPQDTHLAGHKDICIATQYTHNIKEYAMVAVDNQARYAKRHGYHAFSFVGRPSGERFLDPSRSDQKLFGEGWYWQKIAVVEKLLGERDDQGGNLCNWVMWVDADIVFTNFTIALEERIATYAPTEATDVILAREEAGYPSLVNAGAFFVRNSEGGRKFIADIGGMYDEYKNRQLPEQDAMQDTVFQVSQDHPQRSELAFVNQRVRSDMALAPQRAFNSFHRPNNSLPSSGRWYPCDLLAHLAGTPHGKRVSLMEELEESIAHCETR